jgi:hypothetical protein
LPSTLIRTSAPGALDAASKPPVLSSVAKAGAPWGQTRSP